VLTDPLCTSTSVILQSDDYSLVVAAIAEHLNIEEKATYGW
jgi:hypothetical protein